MNTVGERASNGYNLSCFDDNSFGGVVLDCIFGRAIFMVSIDGDLDGDGAATDLLALEGVDGLLLFGLVANVNKAVTLAPSGLPPPSNDASGNDLEASISEKSGQPVVVDVEAEVRNEEHILGWFTDGILTSGTRGTGEPRPATELRFVGRIFCTVGFGSVRGRSGGLSIGRLGPVAAIGLLLFLLGLLRFFGSRSSTRSSFSLVSYLTIRLGVGDFSGDRLGTSSAAREPPPIIPVGRPGILALFFGWFSNLNDDRTALELSLVESFDGPLSGLDGRESNETVTSRAGSITGPALNYLSADDVTLNWLEEGPQPIIRGGIRKISGKDLETGSHG